ncbi:Uncharacterised protein [Vibrio cholerae]|nr:Uncharacterised protein [Vibrio cholerae]CSI40822.1 Uncharacterised protein [Vibrio cholerae]
MSQSCHADTRRAHLPKYLAALKCVHPRDRLHHAPIDALPPIRDTRLDHTRRIQVWFQTDQATDCVVNTCGCSLHDAKCHTQKRGAAHLSP